MSLANKVSVNTHYTRSVNLERDANAVEVVKAYIPTSRALRTFTRVSDAFTCGQAPRAWSLIGPYGSGKSSFSVFLSQLLSNPENVATKAAQQVLKATDTKLAKQFDKEVKNSAGYLKVLITGAPEPMAKRLVASMADAALQLWTKGKKPKIVTKLVNASLQESIATSEVVSLVVELQTALKQKSCKGILLVIDELGKFLEYEARHYGANDIYLLQTLAEHACKGDQCNLYLFVLLHQSFEQYAKGLGENLKNEWSKVQGRFEEVPFLESAEQVLRVVGAVFEHKFTRQENTQLTDTLKKQVSVLLEQEALPGALNEKEAESLLKSCYPLHPVSAVLLPFLCQKVAQNERTLFSYLGSHEEFGLQDMLIKLSEVGEWIYPHHIYDYFITNQPAVLGDYSTHRRWAEVVTGIERLGDAPKEQIQLLKTIGILNIIGSKGGFKPSKALLELCSATKKQALNALKSLNDKSIVTYRRYSSEYRVWQGSDFDLESVLQEELNNLGAFSLATSLNNSKALMPVVARRYTIQNGALRYFMPIFVDAQTYKTTAVQEDEPRIIFYLAAAQDDEKIFNEKVNHYFSKRDIVALCMNGAQLREATAEVLALRQVESTRQELNTDPVAKREFFDRLTAAEHAENYLLQSLIDTPCNSLWFNQGESLEVAHKRDLQVALSAVLDKVYNKTPSLHNELINRDKPSAQANGARNKLLYAMLNHEGEKDLGIDADKFPPEKAIYRSLLRATGLHKQDKEGVWSFVQPETNKQELSKFERKANIAPAWARINQFLDSTEQEAQSLVELNKELMAPPYGVKAGVLPILYIAIYIVYQHELALYENGHYKPIFTEEMLERFVKRPDEFQFQRFRIQGLNASIFKQYSQVINGANEAETLLDIAKPLASFMGGLPEYTQKTRRGISDSAQSVRSAFNLAKSPERLLFKELPKALGFEKLQEESIEQELIDFSQALTELFRDLKNAHSALLKKQKRLLAQAFNIDPKLNVAELRKIIAGKCHGLENYTVDTQGLRAFIMRLTKSLGDDAAWFENVLMFLGHKPSKKWLDSDQDTAERRLNDFSRRATDLETLSIYEKKRATQIDGDFDVYLLRSVKKGGTFKDQVVAVGKHNGKYIQAAKQAISEALEKLDDKELKLALLAETVDEFLTKYNAEKSFPEKSISTSGKNKLKLAKGG